MQEDGRMIQYDSTYYYLLVSSETWMILNVNVCTNCPEICGMLWEHVGLPHLRSSGECHQYEHPSTSPDARRVLQQIDIHKRSRGTNDQTQSTNDTNSSLCKFFAFRVISQTPWNQWMLQSRPNTFAIQLVINNRNWRLSYSRPSGSLHHHLSYVSYPHRGPGFV